jgi:hypothetical protein
MFVWDTHRAQKKPPLGWLFNTKLLKLKNYKSVRSVILYIHDDAANRCVTAKQKKCPEIFGAFYIFVLYQKTA